MQKYIKKICAIDSMNSIKQDDFKILLKKPLQQKNLDCIVNYLYSIKNIEEQKRIIKVIAQSISINKIKEMNIFGSVTPTFIQAMKSKNLNIIIYSLNRSINSMPCTQVSYMEYCDREYKEGFVYLNTDVISLYFPRESFIIKKESIKSLRIDQNIIYLVLKTEKQIRCTLINEDNLFINKLKEILSNKLILDLPIPKSNIYSESDQNKQESFSVENNLEYKFTISSPEKTKVKELSHLSDELSLYGFGNSKIERKNETVIKKKCVTEENDQPRCSILKPECIIQRQVESDFKSGSLNIKLTSNYSPKKILFESNETSQYSSEINVSNNEDKKIRIPEIYKIKYKVIYKRMYKDLAKYKLDVRRNIKNVFKASKKRISKIIGSINLYYSKYYRVMVTIDDVM
jgi:plasmid maintenance system killer protein